ncbi:unnamed protein product [Notodromas monacha]|uniref:Uncharacterized protein n=1 Tax=Notodromas monacha TaxID=399045 RepID=A0A7R9BRR9_9CRUS|nr:unnamed protein product [Notodromas monacha]CAG0919412.1 unnamed protein product [Notodromas monacha]
MQQQRYSYYISVAPYLEKIRQKKVQFVSEIKVFANSTPWASAVLEKDVTIYMKDPRPQILRTVLLTEIQNKMTQQVPRTVESKIPDHKTECSGTKAGMRTAIDVISRIRWDPIFEERIGMVTVGYKDRFFGTLERSFGMFNWDEELSAVDDDDFAIPQHRILNFKYRDEIIWDKNSRTDSVFFSTNGSSKSTLEEVLHEIDLQKDLQLEKLHEMGGFGYSKEIDEWDEDDGPGPAIVTGTGFGQDIREKLMEQQLEDRSTHFIALRITEQDIVEKAMMVQQNALRMEPILEECCMKEKLFHITFCMLRLEGYNAITKACQILFIKKRFVPVHGNILVLNSLPPAVIANALFAMPRDRLVNKR